MPKIPINLITGFLGAGKTSAIQSLLPFRPASERWAVLINEYGMVSLDHILVNDSEGDLSGVHVDEMAGGCFCCSLSMELPLMLARIIRKTQPHRILLEPTGSGHPASVIDLLRSGRPGELLDLRATIALVDPRDYENPRITNSDVFHDQLQMADVVAINFTDKCDPEQIRRCRTWIESLDPPKLLIAETTNGQLKPEWLDLSGHVVRPPQFANAHEHESSTASSQAAPAIVSLGSPQSVNADAVSVISQEPLPGKPVRFENSGLGQSACGWIFSPAEVFDRDQVLDLLAGLNPILRLKGIFRCEDDWWSIQRRGQDTRFQRTAWRRDSRLEIIISFQSDGWLELESKILGCRVHP